jgi:hypothetical protein
MADLRAFDDLDEFGAECSSAVEELEQDIFHRLIERYGSNADVPDRGESVDEWLSSTIGKDEAVRRIENECLRDQRVAAATVKIVEQQKDYWLISIEIQTNEDELSKFDVEVDSDGLRRVA